MFDISWSELLILGVVTLVFVGPKELPALMRTLGKYAGVVRRHANEFKSQFDAAMREAELESMREEVEKMQTSINNVVAIANNRGLGNFVGNVLTLNPRKDEKITGRIDWNITDGQRLSVSYINAYDALVSQNNTSTSATQPSFVSSGAVRRLER